MAGLVAIALAAPRGGDALFGAIAIAATVTGVVACLSPGLRARRPVLVRFAGTVASVGALLLATAVLSTTTDYNLAIAAAVAVVLVGLSLLTGVSGQISRGNGAFMGVGAYAMAIWANHHSTTPIVVSLLISCACGAVVGLLLGLPATRLRGPYLAGMTLAFAVAFGAILIQFASWTGGDSGLQLPHSVNPPRWVLDLFGAGTSPLRTSTIWLADLAVVVAGVAFFFMANLFASRVGRAMRLVRDHDVAAELVGVSLSRTRVLAFVVSATYAALGGALLTIINNAVSEPTYGFVLSITILAVVVIGGIGTVGAAVIGALIYAYSTTVINWFVNQTGLNPQGNLASQLNGIIFGGLLILTMIFAPMGVVGGLRALARRARKLT
ncbi:MAG TPA: branched-chain amino acid ABC transporter permease [Acidimicrobiales bacterium]|nr:branched-chain amino acid ABC transporter permease [Acidimicrobiales bacterium]